MKLGKSQFVLSVIALFCMSFGGCSSEMLSIYIQASDMEQINIDVMRPAKNNYTLDIYNILALASGDITNQMQVSMSAEYNYETEEFKIGFGDLGVFFNDLKIIMNDAPKYRIANDSLLKRDIYDGKAIDWQYARALCDSFGVEGILLIKEFSSYFTVFGKSVYPYPYYNQSFKYALRYKPIIACEFIDPFNGKKIDRARLSNSRYWQDQMGHEIVIGEFLNQNSDKFDYFLWQSALKYAQNISPVWIRETRDYYGAGNVEFIKAHNHVKNNNWHEAKKIWLVYKDAKKKKWANFANYNLALAYEMEGDLEKALEYANYAASTHHNYYAKEYAGLLKKRIEDQKIIKVQMGE